jgi:ferritin-like metal-binding protein YciE
MAEMNTLRDAFVDEIKDLFNAEKQLTKALPKLAKNATNPELREALESHLAETQEHVARLEQIFELLDETVRGKHCAGMAGIIEEGSDMLGEDAEDSVKDACIIAAGQRAEHYEMAAYGTCVAWANALGLEEVSQLLEATLAEEKAADEKLSALAEAGINEAATAGADEEDEDEDEAEENAEPVAVSAGRSAKAAGGAARSAKSNGRRR